MKNGVRVAAIQYRYENLLNWNAFENKIEALLQQAQQHKIELIVFPEYLGMELSQFFPGSWEERWHHLQQLIPQFIELFQKLARRYQMIIQAGTIPILTEQQHYYNRAFLFDSDGKIFSQDKYQLTRSEINDGALISATQLNVFDTSLGKIGIAICYDVEFPALVHALVNEGANIILVPSYTDSLAGYYRVHLCARARALENQCFVIHSTMQGLVDWSDSIEETVGNAGIFSPVDIGFPDDGVLALGSNSNDLLVIADLALHKLERVRKHGSVTNFYDMQKLVLPKVEYISRA